MTTTSRLLTLLSLLQTRRDWPGALLAERLEISHRTVRRDVDRLREMGYRIEATMGPDGGYRLDAGSDLPPLLFDDDQVIALAVSLQAATATGAGIEEAALRALTTVRQVMPARLRNRMEALEFTTMGAVPGRASSEPVAPDVLVALSTAVRAREVLRFEYGDGDGAEGSAGGSTDDGADDGAGTAVPRRVEPHHLVTSNGRWYLVAWDLEREDWRIFRADRIRPRTPTGPRFTPREVPGGDVRRFVGARFRGSEAGGPDTGGPDRGGMEADLWPCRGAVVLHRPAREVLPFAGDGTVEDIGPDRCRLELGSWSWVALAASLGRFDTSIEVIEPPELADAFAELARRFARTAAPAAPAAGREA
jgi:predicted DNA-binding transcriptional regulator YafY